MTQPHLPYPLDLGDGRAPIMCRDAHQASLLLGIWRAWNGGVRAELGLNELGAVEPPIVGEVRLPFDRRTVSERDEPT